MSEITVLKSLDQNSIVKIENGELISYKKNNEELIHQKGNPGWRNSDTEMFPIVGPTEDNNFVVSTPKGNCKQDQHGILRELEYVLTDQSENFSNFQKIYVAYTKVKNSKYPEKSTIESVFWPYNFSFTKKYELSNNSLIITFEIESEKGMPFMLGYHPAFKLLGDKSEICKTTAISTTIQEIIDGGSKAYPILNTNKIQLLKKEGYNIELKTEGFNNFMLWTEVSNMLCIEPITEYPYTGNKTLSEDLYLISKGKETFIIEIKPY